MRKRFKSSLLLSLVLLFVIANVVLAATWEFKFPTIVTDTSGAARAYYPAILGWTGQTFIDSGKIASSGLDTNMQVGTSDVKYMLSTTKSLAVIPNLPASGKQNVDFYTGSYSAPGVPSQTGFPIIVGEDGWAAVSDVATLELGNDGNIQTSLYFDAGTAGNIIDKTGAINVSGDGAGNVTASLFGGQVLHGGYNAVLLLDANDYNVIMGGAAWTATESDRYQVVPTSGTLKNLYIRLSGNVAAGATVTFTVRKNGAAQALTTTISAGASTGSDLTHVVDLAAGDYITLNTTFTGAPGVALTVAWSTLFVPNTTGETIWMSQGYNNVGAVQYMSPQGVTATGSEPNNQVPMPTAGTASKMYVKTGGVPGAGGLAVMFREAAGDTTLTCTVAAAATTASDLVNTNALVAGDLVDVKLGASPNAVATAVGIMFTPTVGGENVVMGGSNTDQPNVAATEYLGLCGTGGATWTATESDIYQLTQYSEISNLYVNLTAAPVGAATQTLSIRDSSAGGGNSGLTVTITAAATTGSDTAHTYVTTTASTTDMRSAPAGGPAATFIHWGLVCVSYQTVASVTAAGVPSADQVIKVELEDTGVASWWDLDWLHRQKLTFDNALVGENLIDFPVLVHLDAGNFDFSLAQAAGQDIRFVDADDTTELDYEIEKWTATEAWIWVEVPQIDMNSAIDFIYMYYDNSTVADGQDVTGTWNANYLEVLHMNVAPPAVIQDSTSNNLDGTPVNMEAGDLVNGDIDGAINYGGTDEYHSLPAGMYQAFSDASNFTYEVYLYFDGAFAGWEYALSSTVVTGTNTPRIGIRGANANTIEVDIKETLGGDTTTVTSGAIAVGWHHAVLTFVGGTDTLSLYIDGVLVGSDGTHVLTFAAGDFSCGSISRLATSGFFTGIIDEARVENTNRSVDWLLATSDTLHDTYITYAGDVEAPYLAISVGGVEQDRVGFASEVVDNNNDWVLMSNATPYLNYYKQTVGVALVSWYEPNTMLNDTTLVDRQGGDEPATITWGANTNLTVTYGEMVSYESTTAASTADLGFDMPTSTLPSTWFAAGENLSNLPFYDSFLSVSLSTGQPLQTIYFLAIIGFAFGVFLLLVVSTRSALLGAVGFNIVLFVGSSMSVIPMWIPFVCLVVMFGIMYLYRQVSY